MMRALVCAVMLSHMVAVDSFCFAEIALAPASCLAPIHACHRMTVPASQRARRKAQFWMRQQNDKLELPAIIPRANISALMHKAAVLWTTTILSPADATVNPIPRPPPQYIDVAVDLGLGADKVLNVRQPYGLPRASAEDRKGGGDRQGTYVWPASTDLGKFLVSDAGRLLVRRKRVVELGAGTAISGLAASLGGAALVVFTDGSEEVLAVTRDTVERNRLQVMKAREERAPLAEPYVVTRLSWGSNEDVTRLLELTGGEFDVVLGAEITYLSASIGPLMSSIQALLSSSSSSSTLRGGGAGGGGGGLIEELAKMPVALLTFTPELTAFDGGGVRELERKAQEHGLRVRYLPPPPKNADPDTLLIALTLLTT